MFALERKTKAERLYQSGLDLYREAKRTGVHKDPNCPAVQMAAERFKSASALHPRMTKAALMLGIIYHEQGDRKHAMEQFRTAMRLSRYIRKDLQEIELLVQQVQA